MHTNKNNFCVIMAGGIGSRLWPMSRTYFPKQFHDVLGTGETLLQQTFNRFLKLCPKENIYIVTNSAYSGLVKEQIEGINQEQIILETSRRNTAPCISYANHKIALKNPNANIIVAPSDHLILKEENFIETVQIALNQTIKTNNLITLGIKPSRPDTGYGYIQFIPEPNAVDKRVRKVKTFTEKPNTDLAKEFLNSGDFYWNSGIFVWSIKSITEAFEKHLPEIQELFTKVNQYYNTPEESAKLANVYSVCESISIDYGILEKADNVNVVLSDFGWSDLGTWGSLYSHIEKDENQNAVVGKNVTLNNSHNNMISASDKKLVVLEDIDNYIVIDTPDVLLVFPIENEQRIKQIVSELKVSKNSKFV